LAEAASRPIEETASAVGINNAGGNA